MELIKSNIDIMPLVAYGVTVIGYLPEIYSQCYIIIYRKPTKYRVGESIWIIWIGAAATYAIYAYFTGQIIFIISNAITAILCFIVFCLRLLSASRVLQIVEKENNILIDVLPDDIVAPAINSDFVDDVGVEEV